MMTVTTVTTATAVKTVTTVTVVTTVMLVAEIFIMTYLDLHHILRTCATTRLTVRR